MVGEQRELEVKTLAAQLAESETRASEQLSQLRQQASNVEERLARLESFAAGEASSAAHFKIGIDSLVATVQATGINVDSLLSDMDALRRDMLSVVETGAIIARRQESNEAVTMGTRSALEAHLPALQTQLERLTQIDVGPLREAAANEGLSLISKAQAAASDGFYVALEARFRGPRSIVRERQSRYLPEIADALKRVEYFPPPAPGAVESRVLDKPLLNQGVIDLGCGRGEWLALLKEQGIPALGLDQNRFFLQSCRQQGLDVIDADVMNFLRSAPGESVAAVTVFHLIEHLPLPVFQEMVCQVFRVLRRGGVAIFETPNPGNLLTGSLNFLIDPTHFRPVHPEFARFVLETGGFSSVKLEFMSPYETSYHVGKPDDPVARRFNDYFYGPQDYAVFGIKP